MTERSFKWTEEEIDAFREVGFWDTGSRDARAKYVFTTSSAAVLCNNLSALREEMLARSQEIAEEYDYIDAELTKIDNPLTRSDVVKGALQDRLGDLDREQAFLQIPLDTVSQRLDVFYQDLPDVTKTTLRKAWDVLYPVRLDPPGDHIKKFEAREAVALPILSSLGHP